MSRFFRLLLPFFLLFLCIFSVNAGDIQIVNLNKNDGLSSNFVSESIQDKQGYIWIQTKRGIDRFDGAHFLHFPFSEFGGEVSAVRMTLDNDSTPVVLTNKGDILRFNYLDFQFQTLYKIEENFVTNQFHLEVDHNGLYWISYDRQLLAIDLDDKKILYQTTFEKPIILLLRYSKRQIIVATQYTCSFVSVGKKEAPFIDLFAHNISSRIRSLLYDKMLGGLWIGTHQSGLFFYNMGSKYLMSISSIQAFNKYPFLDIDIDGTALFVATAGGGLLKLSRDGRHFQNHYYEKVGAISDNSIQNLLITKDQALVLSYYRYGIALMSTELNYFNRLTHYPGSKTIKSNAIGCIAEPVTNEIWFGTTRGISIWDRKVDQWRQLSFDSGDNQTNNLINSLSYVGNTVYIASNFRPLSSCVSSGRGVSRPLTNDYMVNSIATNGELLCYANWKGEINRYELKTGKLERIPSKAANSICYDERTKTFFIGTHQGLYALILSDNYSSVHLINPDIQGAKSITYFADSTYVAASLSGVVYFHLKKGVLRRIDRTDGLKDNNVMSVVADGSEVWCTTENGLYRINDEYRVEVFDGLNNALALSYNSSCSHKDSQGNIYFGSNEGVVWFNPSLIENKNYQTKFVITQVTVGLERLCFDPQKEHSLVLNHDQRSFAISFANLSYQPFRKTVFEWMLEGFEQEWQSSLDDRAKFTRVPSGSYRLIVRNAHTKEVYLQLPIVIRPVWWLSEMAFIIYAVLLLLIALTVYLYVRRVYNKSKAQEILAFLLNTVHDIKTPLSLILAPLDELIEQFRLSDQEAMERLLLAKRNAQKIQQFTVDILDMRRSSALGATVERTFFDIAELVRLKIMSFKLIAQKKGVVLRSELSEDGLYIESDPNIMERILDNLLSNAIKYIPEESLGEVVVRFYHDKSHLYLTIKDNGIGIARSQISRIFTPFFRAKNAWKVGSEGSGLGLVIARNFVLMLNGTISISSQENRGTTVRLTFPYVPAKKSLQLQDPFSLEDNETDNPEQKTILMVDDNKEFVTYLSKRLNSKGFKVTTAQNGKEALELLNTNIFDLMITDNDMPIIDGRELVQAAKENINTSHIPVIMLSGLIDTEDVQKGMQCGADIYLPKPIDFNLLCTTIHTLFENRRRVVQQIALGEYKQRTIYQNDLDNDFIEKVTSVILQNIDNIEFSVVQLSQVVGMSRTALYNKVKSLTHVVPNEFIRLIRLSEARKLLLNPKYNITDVAFMVGFSDAKYFGTCFKKQYGLTPSQFILQNQTQNDDFYTQNDKK